MTNSEVFIISGLGADERVFSNIDFSGIPVTFVRWITPFKNESIAHYASRLKVQVNPSAGHSVILLGLSFGGIMAVELAKQLSNVAKVIMLSTVKTRNELPLFYRMGGSIRLHRLISLGLTKRIGRLLNYMFGAESENDKLLLKKMVEEMDPVFYTWAIDAVVRWQNNAELQNVIHIHGTHDRVFPHRCLKSCHINVKGGGHLMVLNRAEELTHILRDACKL